MSAGLVAALAAVGFSGAALLALLGGQLGARGRAYSAAVAAGILLALAFADLFPEGLELAPGGAISGFVGGFLLMFLIETSTRAHPHHPPDEDVGKHALAPFVFGLAVHNLADGFALGVGARADDVTTALLGVGVLVHQVPVGISLAAVLVASNAKRNRVVWTTLALGLAIPLAAASTLALPVPGGGTLGALIGVAGGVLAYVGAAHLLPQSQAEHAGRGASILFAAALVATTASLMTVLAG